MILRDPVHGLVTFERGAARVIPELLDTPELQRLRRVRALGVASLSFPGGEHSRFSHAVGAAHVMQRFLRRVVPLAKSLGHPLGVAEQRDALAAALAHDVGHGPLSHLFEDVFPSMPAHELWTSAIVLDPDTGLHRALAAVDPEMPSRVERLVHGVHAVPFLARAVSGTFDVDRCDYLLRDSHMTGVRYGLYDLDWLLRSLRLDESTDGPRLAIDGAKGLPAVEGYFLARLFMYQQVYFHKATRAAEQMLRAAFLRLADVIAGGRVPVGTPAPIVAFARGERVGTHAYLSLDDNTLWSSVDAWKGDRDPVLRALCEQVVRRALFKTASLDDLDPAGDSQRLEGLREIARRAGYDPRYHTALDVAEVSPYEVPRSPDDALRVLHHGRRPEALERASFLLSRLVGAPFVRRRLVFPAAVRAQVDAMLRAQRVD